MGGGWGWGGGGTEVAVASVFAVVARYLACGVMIQPPFFIFHPLPKSLLLRHLHQSLSQHVHSKHQFDTSPLPISPCRLHHRLWISVHPVHLVPPSLTSCPSQTSLALRTLICRPHPVPPKPSTFGKLSTVPRNTPLRPEIEPHHRCPWKQSQPVNHVVAKHATPLPHPSLVVVGHYFIWHARVLTDVDTGAVVSGY